MEWTKTGFETPLAMTGFVKRPLVGLPERTHALSTGIPTLDEIICLAPGSISCIFEDEDSFIHNTILQVFVSSSLDTDRKTCVLAKEKKNLTVFKKLGIDTEAQEPQNDLLIAWRYKSSATKEPQFQFNLMQREELDSNARIDSIEALLCLMKTTKNANFAVFSLFSPLLCPAPSLSHSLSLASTASAGQSSVKRCSIEALLLFEIKRYCRLNNHCMLLSIPKFFVKAEISQYFDNVLKVCSMLALPHEKSNYHCLVEVLKLTSIGSLRVNELESYKYGLVLRSKRLAIERIDVPPEDTEPETGTCGHLF